MCRLVLHETDCPATSLQAPLDGNEAAAYIAYSLSDLSLIYPITPSTPMGELSDQWAAEGRKNVFGNVMSVTEMESETGAAGGAHIKYILGLDTICACWHLDLGIAAMQAAPAAPAVHLACVHVFPVQVPCTVVWLLAPCAPPSPPPR